MHLIKAHPHSHHRRQDDIPALPDIAGLSGSQVAKGGPVTDQALATNSNGVTDVAPTAPPIAPLITPDITTGGPPNPTKVSDEAPSAKSTGGSDLPIGVVVGACVGAFAGLALLICLFVLCYKRKTEEMSRNAQGRADQQRTRHRSWNRLADPEHEKSIPLPKPVHPPPMSRDMEQEDHLGSMFKKSPSIRTAYTRTDEEISYDLPQLEFTKYHPSLAEELSLQKPEKPFIGGRQDSGLSWDGETLGDDSFLSMRSVRIESGSMSPTMGMAKTTPIAARSSIAHRWESAEVMHTDDENTPIDAPRNPFADTEERRPRAGNPFFNAQDENRNSRVIRSRSNSRSRRPSLSRRDSATSKRTITAPPPAVPSNPNMNPFLDMASIPTTSVTMASPDEDMSHEHHLPNKPGIPSGASSSAFGNEHALKSLIAALDLSKEEVEARLRVVSMQGSVMSGISQYTDDDASDIATVREFPLPPGTNSHSHP